MKRVICLILAAMPIAAFAGTTCHTIGQYTYCTDTNTGQTTVCHQIGQYTYCN